MTRVTPRRAVPHIREFLADNLTPVGVYRRLAESSPCQFLLESVTGGERGFCATCGSSLFWSALERPTISVAAGTLDGATGLSTIGHIWDEQRADWETLDDLPRAPRGGDL